MWIPFPALNRYVFVVVNVNGKQRNENVFDLKTHLVEVVGVGSLHQQPQRRLQIWRAYASVQLLTQIILQVYRAPVGVHLLRIRLQYERQIDVLGANELGFGRQRVFGRRLAAQIFRCDRIHETVLPHTVRAVRIDCIHIVEHGR